MAYAKAAKDQPMNAAGKAASGAPNQALLLKGKAPI